MRLQSQAHSTGHSELLDDTRSSSPPISFHHSVDAINTRDPPRAASISVIMPGDDIPRFVAWVVPRGSPIASTMPESRNQQQAPDPYSGKLAHTSVVPVHASVGVDRVQLYVAILDSSFGLNRCSNQYKQGLWPLSRRYNTMFPLSDEADTVHKTKVHRKTIVAVLREDIYYDSNHWMFHTLSVT